MRLYTILLHLYPSSFRDEYGAEMAVIFRQRLRDADGAAARVVLWIGTFLEVLMNAVAVHWDITRQDLSYTARTLSRAPGFALTAIVIVALGIGANTAAFSLTDFVLLRPLPFPDADRLLTLWQRAPGYSRMELSPPNYRDWKQAATLFERIGAYTTTSTNLVATGEPERLVGAAVSSDLFTTLGTGRARASFPGRGRSRWGRADDDPGRRAVARHVRRGSGRRRSQGGPGRPGRHDRRRDAARVQLPQSASRVLGTTGDLRT
jgi:hypothetical protein